MIYKEIIAQLMFSKSDVCLDTYIIIRHVQNYGSIIHLDDRYPYINAGNTSEAPLIF